MTETEFRINHSKIIQYYQLIEDRIRAICAALLADEDRNWFDRLDDYETDALGKLIYQVQQIQIQNQIPAVHQFVRDSKDVADKNSEKKYGVLSLCAFRANGLDHVDRPGDTKAYQHADLKYAQFPHPLPLNLYKTFNSLRRVLLIFIIALHFS